MSLFSFQFGDKRERNVVIEIPEDRILSAEEANVLAREAAVKKGLIDPQDAELYEIKHPRTMEPWTLPLDSNQRGFPSYLKFSD